jgi:hypothetical protein
MRGDAAIKARILGLTSDGPRYRSLTEARVHRMLEELGLHPAVNATVAGSERDLVLGKVIIEVDGPQHDLPGQRASDAVRDDAARRAGYDVRRLRTSESS